MAAIAPSRGAMNFSLCEKIHSHAHRGLAEQVLQRRQQAQDELAVTGIIDPQEKCFPEIVFLINIEGEVAETAQDLPAP
jgi:hypothetical protein